MSDDDFNSKIARVKRRALKVTRNEQDAEEIAQQIALDMLEGNKVRLVKQTDHFSLVDILRTKQFQRYNRDKKFTTPVLECQLSPETNVINNRLAEEIDNSEHEKLFLFVKTIAQLRCQKQLTVVILQDIYEWKVVEISKLFGVSSSRICHHYAAAKKFLKEKALSQGYVSDARWARKEPKLLSSRNKEKPKSVSGQESKLAKVQGKENEVRSELATDARDQIPQSISGPKPGNQKEDASGASDLAKEELGKKGIICKRLAKKTINFRF